MEWSGRGFVLGLSFFLFGCNSQLHSPATGGTAFAWVPAVFGQFDFTSSAPNAGLGTVNAGGFGGARAVATDGTHLWIVDSPHNRVLRFSPNPIAFNSQADLVLGQPNFTESAINNGGRSARSLNNPRGIWSDGQRLFVVDRDNHRVLIWNTLPTENFKEADVVIGQNGFTTGSPGTGPASLDHPHGVRTNARGNLAIVDQNNHRVLFFDTIPTIASGASATFAIGQNDLNSNSNNNGGIVTAASLGFPFGVYLDDDKMMVADFGNHRVLIYGSLPTGHGHSATTVLGQSVTTTNFANDGGLSARSLQAPLDVFYESGRLYVSDCYNNRVLRWNSLPNSNFQPADKVIGQPDFASNSTNAGGAVSQDALNLANYIHVFGNRLLISDSSNNRVLLLPQE